MSAHLHKSDNDLLDLLKNGDDFAYNEIYKRYSAPLYIHAFKRLQDKEECRDIIQNLFINIWKNREKLTISDNLPGYLYASVRNAIFDIIKKNKAKVDYIISIQKFANTWDYSADFTVRQNQLTKIINEEIELLPPRTRQIFKLSRFENFSHKQIGEHLNISEQTVKTTVNNALKTLRVKLSSHFMINI